MNTWRKSWK